MNSRERNELKESLTKIGIKGEYLDIWQAKIDLYLHTDRYTIDGKIFRYAGTTIPNQNSTLDSLHRQAWKGAYPFRPSPSCGCKGVNSDEKIYSPCQDRDWSKFDIQKNGEIVPKVVEDETLFSDFVEKQIDNLPDMNEQSFEPDCPHCDYKVKKETKNRNRAIAAHIRFGHKLQEAKVA